MMYISILSAVCLYCCGQLVYSQLWETTTLVTEQFDIRLVDGPTSSEGRLEVYHEGVWGTVCDDRFDLEDGSVACKQLGYDFALDVKDAAFYGRGNGNILLDEIGCYGNETTLAQCSLPSWRDHDCSPSEDVGVRCGDIVAGEVPVHLAGSSRPNRGSVKVYYNGAWGYICRSSWDMEEANVVCTQLGYVRAVRSYARGVDYYDYGPGPRNTYVISEVDCQGDESNLGKCHIEGYDESPTTTTIWYDNDGCYYGTAGVTCSSSTGDGGLGPGKIAGITITCILLVIMVIVLPLVIFRCKRKKLQESATTGASQANGQQPPGVTQVMYVNSATGAPQVVLPYGTPLVPYNQNGQVFIAQQTVPSQQVQPGIAPAYSQAIVTPNAQLNYSNGTQPTTGPTFTPSMGNPGVGSATVAVDGTGTQEKVPLP